MGHLYMVPIVLARAGRDGWLSIYAALVPALLLALVLQVMHLFFPGLSLVEIFSDLLGKPLGKALGLVYTLFFLLAPTITIRGLMDFMNTAFMPQTPPVVLGLLYLVICAYAVLGGLEKLIRVNELLLPLLIFTGLLLFGLTLPDKEYQRLLPILEEGPGPVLLGSIPLISLFGEMVAVAMIQPAVRPADNPWKYTSGGMALIAIMFMGPLTGSVSMFGEKIAASLFYPTFTEIEYINLGDFLQNLQVLSVILWLFGSFGRVSFFLYTSSLSASQSLGLSGYRSLVIPISIIILMAAIFVFPGNLMVREFLSGTYPYISLSLGMILPAALMAVAAVRRYFHR